MSEQIAIVFPSPAFRGHIWTSKTFSAAVQETAIGPLCAVFYIDDIDAAIKSLREGNRLVVAGLRGIGRTPTEIDRNIERVHAHGAAVMDAETGRLSTNKKQLAAMVKEAAKALGNERRGPRKDRRRACMPWDQVAQLYFDPRLSNNELQAAVANGFRPMSYHTMWRHFQKPRGAPVGRPSAQRVAARV